MPGKRQLTAKQSTPVFGVKYIDDVITVERGYVYKAINCHLSRDGVLFTRGGSRKINATALNGPITSIYDYRRPDGSSFSRFVLVTTTVSLYTMDIDVGTFTKLRDLNSTDRPDWTTFNNTVGGSVAVMCNGTDFFTFDGFTLADITFVTGIDAPRYLQVVGDRVLASGCDSDPYKVFVSDELDVTEWEWDSGSPVFWTIKGASGDRINGLGIIYNFGVIQTQFSTSIITEANANSTTSEQILVSREYGTTSNWSMQSIGNVLYFADESHLYRGTLRTAVENGLDVTTIDENIQKKYKDVKDVDDIVSVYDAKNEEIQWGLNMLVGTKKDTALVYSVQNSGDVERFGRVDAWAGWFENVGNYEPHTFGVVLDDEEKPVVYRGDSDGYVYAMDEERTFKDDGNDIATEIITAPFQPQGYSQSKRARFYTCSLYQFEDSSTTIQWLVDASYWEPSAGRVISLQNLLPYYREADSTTMTTTVGSALHYDHPMVVRPITVNNQFRYIQFRIYNNGDETRDEIAYSGGELVYQAHGIRRYQG